MCEWHKAISMHKIEIRNTKKGAEGMRRYRAKNDKFTIPIHLLIPLFYPN